MTTERDNGNFQAQYLNLSNHYLTIIVFQNMNPSNLQQCINERPHPLKCKRVFTSTFGVCSNPFRVRTTDCSSKGTDTAAEGPSAELLSNESHSKSQSDGATQATGIHTIKEATE